MEQTANTIDHKMTDKIIEEEVNQEYEEVKQEDEEVNQEEEPKQVKTITKAKPKAKPKTQQDTETRLTKAEMKELADINNQFHTLLNRIDKIPSLDKLTKELLKYEKHILKSMMQS